MQAQAKNKKVKSVSKTLKSVKPGRVHLDLTKVTVTVVNDDGSEFDLSRKYWKSRVDEYTGKKWCDFISSLKAPGAGESRLSTSTTCRAGVRDTPEHNSLTEFSFPYIAELARATIKAANVLQNI